MDANSFTARANYRIYAATMPEFLCARALGIADTGDGTSRGGYSASAALQRLGDRVIKTATAKYEVFAITVNGDTIGVVAIDLERGVPVRNVIAGTGVFTGSFVININQTRQTIGAAN